MLVKRANTMTQAQLGKVLDYVSQTSYDPLRDYCALLLSFKAGMRVGEISSIKWKHFMNCEGELQYTTFVIPGDVAKGGRYREVPVHPVLFSALKHRFDSIHPGPEDYVVPSVEDINKKVTPNGLQKNLSRIYKGAGFIGCSSHSGRRTFITTAARTAVKHNCSLLDVQKLAGHSSLTTTQVYIEPSANQGRLVNSI